MDKKNYFVWVSVSVSFLVSLWPGFGYASFYTLPFAPAFVSLSVTLSVC